MNTDEMHRAKLKSDAREAMLGLCKADSARAAMVVHMFDTNDYDRLDEFMTMLMTDAHCHFSVDVQRASLTGKGFKSIEWRPWRFIKEVKLAREKLWHAIDASHKWRRFHTGILVDDLLGGI